METHQGKLSFCQACSHRDSGYGYIITFVCHVTLQDHVIKSKSGFMVRSLSKYVTILKSLVAIGTVLEEIYLFLFVT